MTSIDNEKIGNLIKQLREDYCLTLTKLASELNVSQGIVGQWESGNKGVSITHLYKLSKIFNVSVNELVEGKLQNEGSIDYLNRNFDLNYCDINELIKAQDENQIENYLNKCISIRSVFYKLVFKWVNDDLNEHENEEFKYLKRYVSFNNNVFGDKRKIDIKDLLNHEEDQNLKECIKDYFNSKCIEFNTPNYKWEISKIVSFNFKFKPHEIINLGFKDCSSLVMELFDQQQLDELLALYLREKKSKDLANDGFIASIIDAGGNCIYRMHSYENVIGEELIPYIDGDLTEDEERTKAWESCLIYPCNFGGRSQIYSYKDEWKTMSLEDYKKTIMSKKTKYLRDLYGLKYKDPKQYFYNLKNNEYDTYL